MFVELEYKLLISDYMSKDEYKNLIQKCMEEYNITYINAKQYISRKQRKQFEPWISSSLVSPRGFLREKGPKKHGETQ
jgi:hypothetical protein